MAKIDIAPGNLAQVHQIIDSLRQIDVIELSVMGGDPAQKVLEGWSMSSYRGVFTADGEPVCVFGVVPSPFGDGDGVPWMVSTDTITKVPKAFLLASSGVVERMRTGFRDLRNATHKDNEVAINWLRWLGFRVSDEPVGPGGVLRMFSMPGLPAQGAVNV